MALSHRQQRKARKRQRAMEAQCKLAERTEARRTEAVNLAHSEEAESIQPHEVTHHGDGKLQPVAISSGSPDRKAAVLAGIKVVGPAQARQVPIGTVIFVDPKRVLADPTQPRKHLDAEELETLADSLEKDGQEEPAHVFHIKGDPDHDWMLTSGERRKRACEARGLPLMVLVKPEPRSELLRLAREVIVNENHVDLTPIEKAWTIKRFLDGGKEVREVARLFGKSEPWVYQMLDLLKLVPQVQAMMTAIVPKKERLGPGVGREIAKLPVCEQLAFAQRVRKERLTIGQVQRYVRDATGKGDETAEEEGESFEGPGLGTSKRPRVPSDDRKVFDAFLKRVARIAAEYGGLSQEQFDLMFAPRSLRDHFLSVSNAERVVNNMRVVLAKLRQAKGQPERTAVASPPTESTVSEVEAPSEASAAAEPPKQPDRVILVVEPGEDGFLSVMAQFAEVLAGQLDSLELIFNGKPDAVRLAALKQSEKLAHDLASLRLRLKRLGSLNLGGT